MSGRIRGRGRGQSRGRHAALGGGPLGPAARSSCTLPTQPMGKLSDAPGPAIIHIQDVPVHVQEADLHASFFTSGVTGYVRVQLICPPMQQLGMANATFETRMDAERAIQRLQEMFQENHRNGDWVPSSIQIKMRTNLLPMAMRLTQVKALDDAAKDLIGDGAEDADVDADIIDSPRFAQKAAAEVAADPPRRRVTLIPGRAVENEGAPTARPQAIVQEALPSPPPTAGVSSHVLAASRQLPGQQADAARGPVESAATGRLQGPPSAQHAPQDGELFSQPSTVSIGGGEAAPAANALHTSSDAAPHVQIAADAGPKRTRKVSVGPKSRSPEKVPVAKANSQAGSPKHADRHERAQQRSRERDARDGKVERKRSGKADLSAERRAERDGRAERDMADRDRHQSPDRRRQSSYDRERASTDGRDKHDQADLAQKGVGDRSRYRDDQDRSRSRRKGLSNSKEIQGKSRSRVPAKSSREAKADEDRPRDRAAAPAGRHRSKDASPDLAGRGDRQDGSHADQSKREEHRREQDAEQDRSKRPKLRQPRQPTGEGGAESSKAQRRSYASEGRKDVPASLTGRKRPRDEEAEPETVGERLQRKEVSRPKNDHRDPSNPNRQVDADACDASAMIEANNKMANAAMESEAQLIGGDHVRAEHGAIANGACDPDTTAALLRQRLGVQHSYHPETNFGTNSPDWQTLAASRSEMPLVVGGRGSDVSQAGAASTAAADVVAHLASLPGDQAVKLLTGHLATEQNGGPTSGNVMQHDTADAVLGEPTGNTEVKQPSSMGRGGRRVVWIGSSGQGPHKGDAAAMTQPAMGPRASSRAEASAASVPSAALNCDVAADPAMQRASGPLGGATSAAGIQGPWSPVEAPKGMGLMFKGIKSKVSGKPAKPGRGTAHVHLASSEATSSGSQQGSLHGGGRLLEGDCPRRVAEMAGPPQRPRQVHQPINAGQRDVSLGVNAGNHELNGDRHHVSYGPSNGMHTTRGRGRARMLGGRGTGGSIQGGTLQPQRSFQRSPLPHQHHFVAVHDRAAHSQSPISPLQGNGMMPIGSSMDRAMREPHYLPHEREGLQVVPGRGLGQFSMEQRMNGSFMPEAELPMHAGRLMQRTVSLGNGAHGDMPPLEYASHQRPMRHIGFGHEPDADLPPHLAGQHNGDLHHLGLKSPQGPEPLQHGNDRHQSGMAQRQGGRGQHSFGNKTGAGEHAVRHQSNEDYPPGDLSFLPRFMANGILQLVERFGPHLRLAHFNTRVLDTIGQLQAFQMEELLARLADVDWAGIAFPPPYIVSTIKSMRGKQQRQQR